MRRARAGGLAIVAALALGASALAANVPGTTYVDKGGHYKITIPRTWQVVPRTVPQVKKLIAKLENKKSTGQLAAFYKHLIASANERKQLSVYRFQAFDWPASLTQPVPVEVSVGIAVGSKAYGPKDLPTIGTVYANAFKSNQGAKVAAPTTVKLPAGTAELIQAAIPVGQNVYNGVALFLIPRGKALYELTFQIEASQLSSETVFYAIAKQFRFTN
jgi:hypothetical protein